MHEVLASDSLLPFPSHFVSVGGHRMHYIDEGQGPVVVLIHGNPTWCFYYRNLVRDLRDTFRVIAPDFLGCGLSDRVPGAFFRSEHRIKQLEEFVEALQLRSYSLVLHDWGGPLGTGLAVRHPERVEKIVYLNTTLTETESLPTFIKIAAHPFFGKFFTMTTPMFVRSTTKFGVAKKLKPDVVQKYSLPYRTAKQREAIWRFVADIPFDNSHPSYAAMLEIASGIKKLQDKPVKIIWGLRDPCFHREMLSKVARHFPNAEVLEIPHASHLVLEDAPEIANPAVRDFLLRGREGQPSLPAGEEKAEIENHAIISSFMDVASKYPDSYAAIVPKYSRNRNATSPHYEQVTYSELSNLVNRYQRGLDRLGLTPGDRVLMLVPPSTEFLATSLAVMGRGATPVFVDPGIGLERLFRCIQDADPHVFIGSPRAQVLRLLNRSLFKKLKFHVTIGSWAPFGGHTSAFLKKFASAGVPSVVLPSVRDGKGREKNAGLIAFTSGATGTPKGVILTNDVLRAQLSILSKHFNLAPKTADLPLLGIFSLYNVALGVTSVFPLVNPSRPLSLDPERIVNLVRDLRIDSSFGSPTLWNKIAEYCIRTSTQLPSLKRIFMAGAPVPLSTLDTVAKIIPQGECYTPYGATEALPVSLSPARQLHSVELRQSRSGEQGVLLGCSLPELEVRIIGLSDDQLRDISEARQLAAGEIGEIIVRGKNVSPEYLHRPDANRMAKIPDGNGSWHRMGDLGYLDETGNLYFCGRKVHSVYTPERTYHSVPVEEVFNRMPNVRRSALVALAGGREAGLAIEPHPQHWPESPSDRDAFIRELETVGAQSDLTRGIKHFFFHQSFPVDARHNAKIFRDQLSVWADRLYRSDKAA